MTNKEYISATLSRFNISDSDIDLILVNQGLNPDDQAEVQVLKMAIFKEITLFLPLANISEGGMSISWNIEALKTWYSLLAKELGEEDLLNPDNYSVEDVSYLM